MTSPASPSASPVSSLPRTEQRRWTTAVFVVFFVCGVGIASWLARIPSVRDRLGASTFEMGLLIGGLSGGSIVGLLLSGHVVTWLGSKRTIAWTMSVSLCGLAVVAVGSIAPSYLLIFVGLTLFGIGYSITDVAMNLSGAANERVIGRTIMPLFHALFSLGTMAGAGLGALLEKLHVAVVWHFTGIVVLAALMLAWAVPHLQPESYGMDTADAEHRGDWKERLAVWKQPLTLLIGVIVLGMAFAEGSAGDWLALAMVDDRGTSNSTGALIYGVFVTAMTIGRAGGVFALDRFGRVPVLRASAIAAMLGLALVIWVPSVPVAIIGTVLWGLGASLGFPVGMSAAADDPRHAAARVSAVATIGYLAFLVGPPGIGLLGQHIGLLNALIVVLVLIGAAAIVTPAARERTPAADVDDAGAIDRPGR